MPSTSAHADQDVAGTNQVLSVLLYSSNAITRENVRLAVGRRPAPDVPPVRWTECVQLLASNGAVRIAECGPGKVLAGLVKRIDKGLDARAIGGVGDFQGALADWQA